MSESLKKLFWPILKFFETGDSSANYKKSHRVALIIVGVLFLALGSAVGAFSTGDLGALIPVIVFVGLGLVAVVVGTLGSNGAVSKIWGTNKK